MTAFERYELTLTQFMMLRHEGKDITLREYCKENHVNYRPMTAWLSRKGIYISKINPPRKRKANSPILENSKVPEHISDQIFVPIQPQVFSTRDMNELTGISITFPDGVCIVIKQASARALTEFINNYNMEAI